jgi:hypothetical protein
MTHARFGLGLTLAALALGACSDAADDGAEGLPDGAAASFEGIYEISVWSENDSGCDGPGTDVLANATERHFVLVGSETFGQSMLKLISCVDVADCQNKAAAVRNRQSFSFTFSATMSQQLSENELGGFTATTGFEENGVCTMRRFEDHRLSRSGDTATLDTKVKALADRPVENGFCTVEPGAAQQEAASAPCASSSVMTGTRVAGI